jgi:DNA end-binding protein Ku
VTMATRPRKHHRKRHFGDAAEAAAADEVANRPTGARPVWSGTISFGLVAVPVNLFSAVRPADAALRMLAPSGEPLQRHYQCPEDGKDTPWEELVRGFEVDDGKFVALTDAELDSIAPRKTRDIDLQRFVPVDELDPFLFERPYVLTPTGDSTKPYRLLADAMEAEGKAGIATFVMRTKEYLVAIVAQRGILWAQTLRFAGEVRSPKDAGLPKAAKPDAKDVAAFVRTIEAHAKKEVARDQLVERRAEKLRALAARKLKKGEDVVEPTTTAPVEEPTEAPDLFEQIRSSLRLVGKDGADGSRGANGTGAAAPKRRATGASRPRASRRSGAASSGRTPARRRRAKPARRARSAS